MLAKKTQKFGEVQVKTKLPDFNGISSAFTKLQNNENSKKGREMKSFTIRKAITPHHARARSVVKIDEKPT